MLPDTPPLRLTAGDTFPRTNTRYVVASDPSMQSEDGMALFEAAETSIVRNRDGRRRIHFGRRQCLGARSRPLTSADPNPSPK
jgi:hypothetical protein